MLKLLNDADANTTPADNDANDNTVLLLSVALWQPHCGHWSCTSIHPPDQLEICGCKKCSANGRAPLIVDIMQPSVNLMTKLARGQKLMWYNDTAYPTSKLSKSTLLWAPLRCRFLLWSHQWNWLQFSYDIISVDISLIQNVSSVQPFLL